MGLLLPQTTTLKYAGSNTKYAELAGIKNLNWMEEFEISVDLLTRGSNIRVVYLCDLCGTKINIYYGEIDRSKDKYNGMIYCKTCRSKVHNKRSSVSFDQWCRLNGKSELLDRWDYTKNHCLPNAIGYASNKKMFLCCPRGLHDSELHTLGAITSAKPISGACRKCASFAQWGIDNVGIDFLDKYWDYDNNTSDPWTVGSSSRSKVWIKCQFHDYHKSYLIAAYNYKYGSRCPYCSNDKIHPLDSFGKYLVDTYGADVMDKMWDRDKNNLSPFEIPPSGTAKVYLKCPKCGCSIGCRTTNYFKSGGITCRRCYGSTMELKISQYLKLNGYAFEPEYTVPGLIDIFALRFDFAVFIDKRIMLIEYQGEQHYMPVQFSGMPIEQANEAHLKVVKHDIMKKEYCKKHCIPLVYIPYFDKDKYIDIIEDARRNFIAA